MDGATKGIVESLGVGAAGAVTDTLLQALTATAFDMYRADWRQILAAATLSALVYILGHWRGLLRYPDGSTIYALPHDDGEVPKT